MAHKKGQGSSKNGRDSNPQFRGIKCYGGEAVKCGTKFKPGYLVKRGSDDTLFAIAPGTVRFRGRHIDIVPADENIPAYTAAGSAATA